MFQFSLWIGKDPQALSKSITVYCITSQQNTEYCLLWIKTIKCIDVFCHTEISTSEIICNPWLIVETARWSLNVWPKHYGNVNFQGHWWYLIHCRTSKVIRECVTSNINILNIRCKIWNISKNFRPFELLLFPCRFKSLQMTFLCSLYGLDLKHANIQRFIWLKFSCPK